MTVERKNSKSSKLSNSNAINSSTNQTSKQNQQNSNINNNINSKNDQNLVNDKKKSQIPTQNTGNQVSSKQSSSIATHISKTASMDGKSVNDNKSTNENKSVNEGKVTKASIKSMDLQNELTNNSNEIKIGITNVNDNQNQIESKTFIETKRSTLPINEGKSLKDGSSSNNVSISIHSNATTPKNVNSNLFNLNNLPGGTTRNNIKSEFNNSNNVQNQSFNIPNNLNLSSNLNVSENINDQQTKIGLQRLDRKQKTLKIGGELKSDLKNMVVSLLKPTELNDALNERKSKSKGKKKKKIIKHCANDPEPDTIVESEPEQEIEDEYAYKFKNDKEFYNAFCKKFYNDFKITSIKSNQFSITSSKQLNLDDARNIVDNYIEAVDLQELKRLDAIIHRKIDMNEEKYWVNIN